MRGGYSESVRHARPKVLYWERIYLTGAIHTERIQHKIYSFINSYSTSVGSILSQHLRHWLNIILVMIYTNVICLLSFYLNYETKQYTITFPLRDDLFFMIYVKFSYLSFDNLNIFFYADTCNTLIILKLQTLTCQDLCLFALMQILWSKL